MQAWSSLMEEVKQLQCDGDFCKEKIGQVRHGLNEELCVMMMVCCGYKIASWYRWRETYVVDSSRQHIVHPISCTLAPSKCIMIYECIIGGKA